MTRAMIHLLAVAMVAASPALSLSYDCSFAEACVEKLSCGPSQTTIEVRGGAEDAFTMTTAGRTIDVMQLVDPLRETRAYVTQVEFDTIHVLTIFQSGIARYTMHTPIEGLQSVTHFGTCQVLP